MEVALILDTETTDVEEKAEVIELAYVTMDSPLHINEFFRSTRFKPNTPSTLGALAVHHILDEELESCQPSSNAPAFLPEAQYWIGHNIDHDWKALGAPKNVKRICTLALARNLWPDLDSHKLSALIYHFLGRNSFTRALLRNAHTASDDTYFCIQVLREILKRVRVETMEQLWEASENARIPTKMTFGKHKGKLIHEVDRGWATWYKNQADTDPYLLEAFRRANLIR